ncbi:DUF4169 family protein [Tranquillimonas alkanivorans]|uniref:DUF4169 domain-containing protein n=1 Tax=Tranquillimonas alkanivorans TaxID=441119 RepID=A0A1I5RBV3_9RHOB|nr:DUF4169 family protein [Tranquillimonas alkanivorans]SFP56014.1 protein of unknown function [Tranquillimonas alkanivorans]
MAKVVNLNKARKARAKERARAEADANATKFGLTKAQKAIERAEAEKARQMLDAHRREDDDDT